MHTSWKIQNEIVGVSNGLILESWLVKNINSSSYFFVIVDETTDIACVEHMSLCIHCLDSTFSKIEDIFLHFCTTGKGISIAIIDKLMALGINFLFIFIYSFISDPNSEPKNKNKQTKFMVYPKGI